MLEVPEDTLACLEKVEDLLHQCLDDGTETGRVASRTVEAGGKRLRPLLVLLGCQAAGGPVTDRVVRVAAGVELIHTASLIHDDIMDEAKLRRGEPTVAAEKGTARAITVGDYLFVKGYQLAAMDLDAETINRVAEACSLLAEGQYKEEDLKENPSDADLYFYVVENKTAGFIAACAEIGAQLGGAEGERRKAFRDFGYNLGVAFQLIDDVLDATGSVETLGKDVGSDVRNGAKGGPAVFTLQAGHARLGELVKDLYATKGVERTKELAEAFADRAREAAETFAATPYGQALRDVASVLLARRS